MILVALQGEEKTHFPCNAIIPTARVLKLDLTISKTVNYTNYILYKLPSLEYCVLAT